MVPVWIMPVVYLHNHSDFLVFETGSHAFDGAEINN